MRFIPFVAAASLFNFFALAGLLGAPKVEILATFEDRGSLPIGPWVEMEDGSFIGSLSAGGESGYGALLQIGTDGTVRPLLQVTAAIGKIENPLIRGSDGSAYGTARVGGTGNLGTFFRVSPSGQFEKLADFPSAGPRNPRGALIELTPGVFYGVADSGFVTPSGTSGGIYRVDSAGAISGVASLPGPSYQISTLHFARNGRLYGSEGSGGTSARGTFFRVGPEGTFTLLANAGDFDGTIPVDFMDGDDGFFYGTTSLGGVGNLGLLFRMTPEGVVTVLRGGAGQAPAVRPRLLTRDPGGRIHGATSDASVDGVLHPPTIFRIEPGAPADAAVTSWVLSTTKTAATALQIRADGTIHGINRIYNTFFRLTPDGTFTVLHNFSINTGTSPTMLHAGRDGRFYGATTSSGRFGKGSAFRLDAAGKLEVLFDFGAPRGAKPAAGLVQDTAGNLYGLTQGSSMQPSQFFRLGIDGNHTSLSKPPLTTVGLTRWTDGAFWGVSTTGAIFRIGPGKGNSLSIQQIFTPISTSAVPRSLFDPGDSRFYGTVSTSSAGSKLFRFDPARYDRPNFPVRASILGGSPQQLSSPIATLVRAADGRVFGRTSSASEAAIFQLVESAEQFGPPIMTALATVLIGEPNLANSALAVGGDGQLYGVRRGYNSSSIYRCRTEASLPVGTARLANIIGLPPGSAARGGLVALPDGKLYGAYNLGTYGPAVIYRFTPSGALETLYSFGATDGRGQNGELTLGSDGALYGVTESQYYGTLFRFDPATRVFTTLHTFKGTDGSWPSPQLSQGLDGNLYGVTSAGGPGGNGVVFGIFLGETRPPLVGTPQATEIGIESAKFTATVHPRDPGTTAIFKYSREGGSLAKAPSVTAQIVDGKAVAFVAGLQRDAIYYFAAIATNSRGSAQSVTASFRTLPNSQPVAVADLVTTRDRRTLTFAPLANDSDPDGDALYLGSVGDAAHGSVTFAGDNTITYQPSATFTGSDSFTYTVRDGFEKNGSATGRVTILDPFRASHGIFAGFLREGKSVAGFLRLNIAGSGTFSAALTLGGSRLAFRGRIGADGNFTTTLAGGRTITLRTLADGSLAGTLTDGARTLTFAASAPHSDAPTPAAGEYTLLFRRTDGDLPAGIGHGHLVVTPDGRARLAGWLGDGTAFSATAVLDAAGELPLYITLDRAPAGSLTATVRFLENMSCDATFTWTRPANTHRAFPAGFAGTGLLDGSRFTAPSALRYTGPANPRVSLWLDLGGLPAPVGLTLHADSAGWSGDAAGVPARLYLQPQSGLIRGFVRDPANPGRKLNVRGIIQQEQNMAAGYFESGSDIGVFTLFPQ